MGEEHGISHHAAQQDDPPAEAVVWKGAPSLEYAADYGTYYLADFTPR